MVETSFRTFRLPPTGPGAAVRIVPAAPYSQRVIVAHERTGNPPEPQALLTLSPNTVDGTAVPSGTVAFSGRPGGAIPVFNTLVFTVPADVAVYAASGGFGPGPAPTTLPTFLAVSVAQTVPITFRTAPYPDQWVGRTTFRQHTLPLAGTQTICVSPGSPLPKLVIMQAEFAVGGPPVRVSDVAQELNNPAPAGFGSRGLSFTWNIESAMSFLLAPQQRLFAVADVLPQRLSVSTFTVDPRQDRGATGIPGPTVT